MSKIDKIVVEESLLRKVVRAVEKGIGEDMRVYLRDNHKETNNAAKHMPGDNINNNLRNMVVSNGIELIPFSRTGWDGRILVDRNNRITYTIMTKRTLDSIPKKKGRTIPHYLQSILYVENRGCHARNKQMSLEDFGIVIFNRQELEDDFDKVMSGQIGRDDNYHHYIIVYEAKRGELTSITLQFLDKDFDIIDEYSLNDYIKLDFAKLTELEPVVEDEEDNKHVRNLLRVKGSGIKPQIRKEKKTTDLIL